MTENNVKDPQHYKIGNLETIDLIQQTVKDYWNMELELIRNMKVQRTIYTKPLDMENFGLII